MPEQLKNCLRSYFNLRMILFVPIYRADTHASLERKRENGRNFPDYAYFGW